MFKFVIRVLLVLFVVVTVFIVLALTSGGRSFRWFGNIVKDASYNIGEVADFFNRASENIKSASHTIKNTGEKLKDIAQETGEKASGIVNATEEKTSGIINAAGEKVKDIKQYVGGPDKPEEKRTATKSDKNKRPE